MPRRNDSRNTLFDLGDFIIEPEVQQLLSYADLQALVLRHARGDWGRVSPYQQKKNEAFVHPRNRSAGSSAQSLHILRNAQVAILTRQNKGRRQTRLFLL